MATFTRDGKTGTISIYHWHSNTPWHKSTGMKVDKKYWNSGSGKLTSSKITYKGTNVQAHLNKCLSWLAQALQDWKTDSNADLSGLYDHYKLGKRTVRASVRFMDFFKEDYEKQELKGPRGTSTWKHYRTTYRILEEYFAGKRPTFEEIDKDFYEDFGIWMEQKKNFMVSTIGGHWKRIKAIMSKAEDKGLHTSQAYHKFVRETYITDKIALSPVELEKIAFAVLPQDLDMVRDYFLLSCYTGARISDWCQFNNIPKTGKIWSYKSNKTRESGKVKLSEKIRAILEKYDYKLPEAYPDQTMNEMIKKMCLSAGITENYTSSFEKGGKLVNDTKERWKFVSSHTGRRTFATILILAGTPVHLVMLQGGWKTLTAFEGYIRLKELQSTQALEDWPVTV